MQTDNPRTNVARRRPTRWRARLTTLLVTAVAVSTGAAFGALPVVSAGSGPDYREVTMYMRPVGETETLGNDCTSPEPGVLVCEQHTRGGDVATHLGPVTHVTRKIVTTTSGGCETPDGEAGILREVVGVPGGEKFVTTWGDELYFRSQNRTCLDSSLQIVEGGFGYWVITGGSGRFEGASGTMSRVTDGVDGVGVSTGVLRVQADLWSDWIPATTPTVVVKPGVAVVGEGDSGTVVVEVGVMLSSPWPEPVSVDWSTVDTGDPGVATPGVDYVDGSGTLTFDPGETGHSVAVTVNGDTEDEPGVLYGEWGVIEFSNPSANAVVDMTTNLDGRGVFVIVNDD